MSSRDNGHRGADSDLGIKGRRIEGTESWRCHCEVVSLKTVANFQAIHLDTPFVTA